MEEEDTVEMNGLGPQGTISSAMQPPTSSAASPPSVSVGRAENIGIRSGTQITDKELLDITYSTEYKLDGLMILGKSWNIVRIGKIMIQP